MDRISWAMRALASLCLAVFLLCGCGGPSADPGAAILGRWVKGNDSWLVFTPEGWVCRVDDRARVGNYTLVDNKTLLVEELSGDSTLRNLWTFELTPKGLELTYPGGEKIQYGRGKDTPPKEAALVGMWTANLGVGKTNVFVFDASGKFMDVRWIRSSSAKDRERKQRRVVEAGRWIVDGSQLKLDGLRRRHFNRSYEFSLAGDQLVLTSGTGSSKRVRTYQRSR